MPPTETVGPNVLMSLGGTVIGTQRGAGVTVETNGIDISSKNDQWARVAAGRRKWSIKLDGVVSSGAGGSMGLLSTVIAGQIVTFLEEDSETGDTLSGQVLITKWERNDPDDDASTYTVEGQGHGELTYTPGAGS